MLDGGGSVSMIQDGYKVSRPINNEDRSINNIIGFKINKAENSPLFHQPTVEVNPLHFAARTNVPIYPQATIESTSNISIIDFYTLSPNNPAKLTGFIRMNNDNGRIYMASTVNENLITTFDFYPLENKLMLNQQEWIHVPPKYPETNETTFSALLNKYRNDGYTVNMANMTDSPLGSGAGNYGFGIFKVYCTDNNICYGLLFIRAEVYYRAPQNYGGFWYKINLTQV